MTMKVYTVCLWDTHDSSKHDSAGISQMAVVTSTLHRQMRCSSAMIPHKDYDIILNPYHIPIDTDGDIDVVTMNFYTFNNRQTPEWFCSKITKLMHKLYKTQVNYKFL